MAKRKTVKYPHYKEFEWKGRTMPEGEFWDHGAPGIDDDHFRIAESKEVDYNGKALVYFEYNDGLSNHLEIAGFSKTTLLRGKRLEVIPDENISAAENYIRNLRNESN